MSVRHWIALAAVALVSAIAFEAYDDPRLQVAVADLVALCGH